MKTVSVGPLSRVQSPSFTVRQSGGCLLAGVDHSMKTGFNEWAALDKVALERGMRITVGWHAASTMFLPGKKYFRDHPDWFAYSAKNRKREAYGGKRGALYCLSNREATAEFARNVIAYARKHPEVWRIAIWHPDGGWTCACPGCSKHTATDNYLRAIGRIARAVKDPGLPLKIEALVAYDPPRELPKQKHDLPDNVMLDLAFMNLQWGAR